VCNRFQLAAGFLSSRRKNHPDFDIHDEYDVQDLLAAVLAGSIPFAIQEEPLSKLAGGPSGRADVAIEELGIIIEVKYARKGSQIDLVGEIAQDFELYAKWPHLQHLIVFIYNWQALRSAESLKKLATPRSVGDRPYDVHLVLPGA
jgi:hypothetical protein